MSNIQKAIAKIKIEGILKEAAIKTIGEQVFLADGTTVEATIASILTNIANLPTESTVDTKVKASCDALYNKIMGLTDADTTINEAYDTLKEVAEWIESHGDVATAFTNDIAGLKTAVQALQAVGATKVEASETNGNIKIDGQEVTVYTPPETISADKVTETDNKQFVTAEEKADWNSRPVIYSGTTEPSNMKNGDVFLQIVTE